MLSPSHSTTVSDGYARRRGAVLHALEARILVRLARRLAEHDIRVDPQRAQILARRIALGKRAIGHDGDTSAERVDELRERQGSRHLACGALVHPRGPALRVEGRVRDGEPALVLGIVEHRFIRVENHRPALRRQPAHELGEPIARHRVNLPRERAILGRAAHPFHVVGQRIGKDGRGLRSG